MSEDSPRGIDPGPVGRWLAAHIDGARPPLRYETIVGGHSNLTFRVTGAGTRAFVLRRPPLGVLLETAHDMAREHRIVSALGPTRVPVPPALGLCEDRGVNGAPFYVMAFVEGFVLEDSRQATSELTLEARGALSEAVVDVLAELHAVDPDEVGLGTLGKKEDYLARQLRRWSRQWESSRTRELPAMDELAIMLGQKMPGQIGASIVHGDYRIGNMLTTASGDINAVLDWELCTLGDPLADLGYLLNNWAAPGESPDTQRGDALPPSATEGFLTRDEMTLLYAEKTGRDVSQMPYYRAFQHWRSAAIVEGVLDRYLRGRMAGSIDTDHYSHRVANLADTALELVRSL